MAKSLMLFLLLSPITLFCQTGSIRGQVTDARTGEALVGANVIVVGSRPGHGAATDMNGMFLMMKIPPGEYVLQASYIDYRTVTLRQLKVTAGQTTEANFALRVEGDTEPVAEKPDTVTIAAEDTMAETPAATIEPIHGEARVKEQEQ